MKQKWSSKKSRSSLYRLNLIRRSLAAPWSLWTWHSSSSSFVLWWSHLDSSKWSSPSLIRTSKKLSRRNWKSASKSKSKPSNYLPQRNHRRRVIRKRRRKLVQLKSMTLTGLTRWFNKMSWKRHRSSRKLSLKMHRSSRKWRAFTIRDNQQLLTT